MTLQSENKRNKKGEKVFFQTIFLLHLHNLAGANAVYGAIGHIFRNTILFRDFGLTTHVHTC